MPRLLARAALGLAAVGGLLGLIFFFHAGALALCLYSLGLLLAMAAAMSDLWLRPIQCQRELSHETVAIGENVHVTTRIFNRAPWPILWMYAEDSLPEKMAREGVWRRLFFLPPRRAIFLHYKLTLDRRGCHAIGPLVTQTGDVFGLFKRCKVDRRRDFVTALPHYAVIEEIQLGQRRRMGDLAARRSLLDDPTRPSGVREYRRGDPLKHIHWKSSARTGELRTKIYEPVTEAGAVVVLDFHESSWLEALTREAALPPAEQAVEYAASVCRYLIDGDWKVGFLTNGHDPLGLPGVTVAQAAASDSLRDALEAARLGQPDRRLDPIWIPPRRGTEQFMAIHENLGRVTLGEALPVQAALAAHLHDIDREMVIVILTGDVNEELAASLSSLSQLGRRIVLMVVCNNTAHDRAFDWLVPQGVELHRLDEDWRLREMALGRSAM